MRNAFAVGAALILALGCGGGGGGGGGTRSWQLVVTLAGDGQGTVAATGLTCDTARCTGSYAAGQSVELVAQAADASDFFGWSGDCAGDSACALDMAADRAVTATFQARKRLMVVQRNIGGGDGSIGASTPGLECAADGCTKEVLVRAGSQVTITAMPAAGSEVGLLGGCDPISGPCTITLDQDRTVRATFTATNIVFVTSQDYPAALGGLPAADAACNERAQAAGLPGTYVAWLSTSAAGAASRLGKGRGWIRPDGAPVADSVTSLTQQLQVFYPPRLDENGAEAGRVYVHTNTTPQGGNSIESDCGGWTSTSGYHISGRATDGSGGWTKAASMSCADPARLYCFGTDLQRAVAPEPTAGRVAFVTTAAVKGDVGLAGADALCATEAVSAGLSQTFEAFLAPTGATAVSRNTLPEGPWVRADGLVVAQTTADLLGGNLRVPIAQTANGVYLELVRVWTGADAPTAPGAANANCSGWSSSTGQGEVGWSSGTTFDYFGLDQMDCGIAGHLYCVER